MKDCVLAAARVLDPIGPHNGQTVDIRVRQGRIQAIAPASTLAPEAGEQVVSAPGLCVAPGFVDAFAHLTDPGFEYRDNLHTLAETARQSGFTDVIFLPDSHPVVDSSDQLLALRHRAEHLPVGFHFMGALSVGLGGKEMAPLYELHDAGALAFSDGNYGPTNSAQLVLMLQYLQLFDGLLVVQPQDRTLVGRGVANESPAVTALGLKGIPALAEELAISLCLQVLAYAGGRIHFAPITTAGGVQLVREGKARGLNITASTAPQYVYLDDTALNGFDPHYKILPPIRTVADQNALIDGLLDGTLDFIASHNTPRALEEKALEFEQAEFGMLAQPIALPMLHTRLSAVPSYTPELLVKWCSTAPRHLFGLETNSITEGVPARLTLLALSDSAEFPFPGRLASRSPNVPTLGGGARLKVLGWEE